MGNLKRFIILYLTNFLKIPFAFIITKFKRVFNCRVLRSASHAPGSAVRKCCVLIPPVAQGPKGHTSSSADRQLGSPTALAHVVAASPRMRWGHAMVPLAAVVPSCPRSTGAAENHPINHRAARPGAWGQWPAGAAARPLMLRGWPRGLLLRRKTSRCRSLTC